MEDLWKAERKITGFIRRKVKEAGAKGIVVGVSGGVDSAATIALCSKAIGKKRVLAIIMPESETITNKILTDARLIAGKFAGKTYKIDFSEILKAYGRIIPIFDKEKISKGNLKARIRMGILYYFANRLGYLVAGTGDRSEIMLGYFTKYGDGGADFLPIAGLWKTEVRELAVYLGIPKSIAYKPSSPGLWKGHSAVQELGLDYSELDPILKKLIAGKTAGIQKKLLKKLRRQMKSTEHKRRMPETPNL